MLDFSTMIQQGDKQKEWKMRGVNKSIIWKSIMSDHLCFDTNAVEKVKSWLSDRKEDLEGADFESKVVREVRELLKEKMNIFLWNRELEHVFLGYEVGENLEDKKSSVITDDIKINSEDVYKGNDVIDYAQQIVAGDRTFDLQDLEDQKVYEKSSVITDDIKSMTDEIASRDTDSKLSAAYSRRDVQLESKVVKNSESEFNTEILPPSEYSLDSHVDVMCGPLDEFFDRHCQNNSKHATLHDYFASISNDVIENLVKSACCHFMSPADLGPDLEKYACNCNKTTVSHEPKGYIGLKSLLEFIKKMEDKECVTQIAIVKGRVTDLYCAEYKETLSMDKFSKKEQKKLHNKKFCKKCVKSY
jgi:hypothetical protein